MGEWTATSTRAEGTGQFHFYANGSYYYIDPEDGSDYWLTYTMTDNDITLLGTDGEIVTFEYTFSDNDNKFSIFYQGTLAYEFTRQ